MGDSNVIKLEEKKDIWVFQPREDDLDDLVFDTENEACAAQQGYRLARGLDPLTGEKASA